MRSYYNENAPFPAGKLEALSERGLISGGTFDRRSIRDVKAEDLGGYTRCHFFAGIGGWDYALALAGWPIEEEVWTGSCPCQPFSQAARGRQHGERSAKHLWPVWRDLIEERRPPTVFGEQVASARRWFDGVCDDMEGMGYSVWASILPACSVGADHKRERIVFVCYTDGDGQPRLSVDAKMDRMPWREGSPRDVPVTDGIPRNLEECRSYGNAIVPQVAAAFIRAFIEAREELCNA